MITGKNEIDINLSGVYFPKDAQNVLSWDDEKVVAKKTAA